MKDLNDKGYLFRLIDKLAEYDEKKLKELFSDETVDSIYTLAKELLDEEIKKKDLNINSFAELVYKLRKYKRDWSRNLGDAIIFADDKLKSGNLSEGLAVLDDFINHCPSSFYRNIAKVQKNKLSEKVL